MANEQNQRPPNVTSQQPQSKSAPPPAVAAAPAVPETPAAAATGTVSLSFDQLQALINGAVQAALATNPQAQSLLGNEGMSTLGDAIAQGISKAQRRRLAIGEYLTQPGRSAFHPLAPEETPKLRDGAQFYQNGTWLNPAILNDDEIRLLNALKHGGRYISRLADVVFQQEGSEETVIVRWRSATSDQRNQFMQHVRVDPKRSGFANILAQIVAEQEAEDQTAAGAGARNFQTASAKNFTADQFHDAAREGRKPWEQPSVQA